MDNCFHNPLAHTDFNMFVDEWTSANESPDFRLYAKVGPDITLQTHLNKLIKLKTLTKVR